MKVEPKKEPTRFKVADYKGEYHRYTAEQLRDRVLEEAKRTSFDNWRIPVSELARATTNPDFSSSCAEIIQRKVIEDFTLVYVQDGSSFIDISDRELDPIWCCFHSLRKKERRSISSTCKSFMDCLISCKIDYANEMLDHPHPGTDFKLFIRSYTREKCAKWQDKQGKDLENWVENIPNDFKSRVAAAEQKGQFKKSDADAWNTLASAHLPRRIRQ